MQQKRAITVMRLTSSLISGRALRRLGTTFILALTAASAVAVPAAAATGDADAGKRASVAAAGTVGRLANYANRQKCMGVEGGNSPNGSRVVLWDCNGSNDQRWDVSRQGNIKNAWGKCLGVKDGSSTEGAPLVIWDCDNSPNQRWRADDSVESGCYILVNGYGFLAGVEGGSTANNASIIQWRHAGHDDQTWCLYL